MSDGLALFLATRDPVKVSREWTSSRIGDVLKEAPDASKPGRPWKAGRLQMERAERMLAEVRRTKESK